MSALPCPFCGQLPSVGGGDRYASLCCANPACSVDVSVYDVAPTTPGQTHAVRLQTLVEVWNTRTPTPIPSELPGLARAIALTVDRQRLAMAQGGTAAEHLRGLAEAMQGEIDALTGSRE